MDGDEGFLSRWARRKADARQGRPLAESPRPRPSAEILPASAPAPAPVEAVTSAAKADDKGQGAIEPAPPPLTLEDARALTQHSDFKPFMAQQVSPDVRNAAMKKLFADPHYNVMDGLDIYIDDYTKSDPIPESMLRQMVGAQFLKLFDDEVTADSVAQSTGSPEPQLPTDHANTHLRLQPDHAAADPAAGSRPA